MMDLSELGLAWERLIESKLLPLIKPSPETDMERSELTKGLVDLVDKCGTRMRHSRPFLERFWGKDTKERIKKISKAADILEETGLDFVTIIQELREASNNLDSLYGPGHSDAERRHQCLEMCRDFLLSHNKHAGIGEANPQEGKAAGSAIVLTQAVLGLATRNWRTGCALHVSDRALRKYAKRSRGDKNAKSKA